MFSTPCTSFQCLFSIEQKNKKRFHGVLRKIYRERGVYWLSAYRICMFKNVDSGGWAVRVFFFPMSFLPSMKKKNIKVPLKRIKCSRAKRGLLWFSQKKKTLECGPQIWTLWCACHLLYIFHIIQTHAYSYIHAPFIVFGVGWFTFFQRTELKSKTIPNGHRVLVVSVCLSFQLDLGQTQVVIIIYTMHWSKGLRALRW